MTNSARRIVSSSFLAGVTKRLTFSETKGARLKDEWLVKHTTEGRRSAADGFVIQSLRRSL